MKSNFRISAKNLFITYSQVDKELKREVVLENLLSKDFLSIENYLIGKENHQDGGTHFHILLKLKKKCNIKNAKSLDILGIHGKYESVRSLIASIKYIIKEDKEFLTNFEYINKDGILFETPEEFYFERAKLEDINDLLDEYINRYPKRALKTITKFKKTLETIQEIREKKQEKDIIESFPYNLNDIDWSHFEQSKDLDDWLAKPDHEKETLVITGDSESGKTFWVLAFCKSHNQPTLYMTDFEGFKNIKEKHKIWVLDDANLADVKKLNTETITKLLDNKTPTDLRLLGHSKRRPHGMIGILISNDISKVLKRAEKRILRRVKIINFDKPLIYLNVNIHNHFYNSKNLIGKNEEIWKKQYLQTEKELLGIPDWQNKTKKK